MLKTPSVLENEGEETPPMTVIAKCLKEAGSYDGSLTYKQMLELYNFLNNSQTTTLAEDEQRRSLSDDNSNYNFVDEMRLNSVPVEKYDPTANTFAIGESSSPNINWREPTGVKDDTEPNSKDRLDSFDEIDVLNSVPTKHPPLTQIRYKPKYNAPLYCNTKIVHLSLIEKKRLITEYHRKLINIYDNFQRKSSRYAPLDKPIQPDIKFDGSLLKRNDKLPVYSLDDDNDFLEQNNNSNDIYITKTGRQTKRKLYTENNDTWIPKSSSNNTPSSPPGSQPKKRMSISTLNNDQIMKRSKLFNLSQNEKLFDKLQENMEKKKEEEKENERFINSLTNDSDDESFDVSEVVHIEEPFHRRRITPPSRKKPPKKTGRDVKSKDVKKTPARNNEQKENTVTAKSPIVENKAVCPMCGFEFPQDKLEAHANQCIDSYEQTNKAAVLRSDTKKIFCENCDQALPFDMEYELHVRECLRNT